MKYLYWIFGVLAVASAGYIGYQYGLGNIKVQWPTKANVVVPANTDTSETQNVLQTGTYPTPLPLPTNDTVPVGNYILNNTATNSVTNSAVKIPVGGMSTGQ